MQSTLHFLSIGKVPNSQVYSASLLNSPLLFHYNATSASVDFSSVTRHFPKCCLSQPPLVGVTVKPRAKEKQILGAARASESEAINPTTNVSEKWLLEPVDLQGDLSHWKHNQSPMHLIGDGDSRHIGFQVEMPGAYEIASSEVTVGRVPEKADLVIPVATVSAVHARIQKKQGNLLVTDLDSTNGTFVDDKRLRPGVVATVSSGSCITFGDTHLAMFRVSKVEDVAAEDTADETKAEQNTDNTQTS